MKYMHHAYLVCFWLLLVAGIMANQHGSAISVNTVSTERTELSFTLPSYDLGTTTINGQVFDQIDIDEALPMPVAGYPEVPVFSAAIAVPKNSKVQIENVSFSKPIILGQMVIYPAQNEQPVDYTFDFEESFYYSPNSELVFPETKYFVTDIETVRDFQFITINIFPMRYYPSSKQLEITQTITMTIRHESTDSSPSYHLKPQLSRVFEPIYESLFDNYEQIRTPNPVYQEPTLLVIHGQAIGTDAAAAGWLNQYVTWKRQRGIRVITAPASTGTGGAGTSSTAIRQFIRDQYNSPNPPEWVLLMGANGSPSASNYLIPWGSGSGDYAYSFMTGNSQLGDVAVGRFDANSVTQLQSFVAKVLQYERYPFFNTDTSWYHRSQLVGVSGSSGVSTYIVGRYIRSLIEERDPQHQFAETYSSSVTASNLLTLWNQGRLHFAMRAFSGNSSFPGQVSQMNNTNRLTTAIALTCSSVSFAQDVTRHHIAAGAITGGGMNGLTHTAYNNALHGGVFYGLYPANMPTMGQAVLFSKLNLSKVYASSVSTSWANTSNDIFHFSGDPSIHIWKTMPRTFSTEFPNSIATGTQGLRFEILDDLGQTVPDTWVTISQVANNVITYLTKGISDENGVVYLQLDPSLTGTLILAVTRPDFAPTLQPIVTNEGAGVTVNSLTINDVNGNNDGIINPGETINISIGVRNYQSTAANNLSATLTSESELVTIINGNASLASMGADATQTITNVFSFAVSPLYPDKTLLPLRIAITDGVETWFSYFTPEVKGVYMNFVSMTPASAGINAETPIFFSLRNSGSYHGYELNARLISRHTFLATNNEMEVPIGNVMMNATINNIGPFMINVLDGLYPGMTLPADLLIYNDDGFQELLPILIPVGTRIATDPTGPCEYGYVMIASDDTDYLPDDPTEIVTPVYNWIDISTVGTNANIIDTSATGEEASAPITLPFTATYYGNDYNIITICSNGWFAFGTTAQKDFRNMPLPGPIAPRNIVAPYWNDLMTGGSYGGIFTYHDEEINAFIIQWHNVREVSSRGASSITAGNVVSFQAIIYDPYHHGTSLGDSPIKFQYHTWHPGRPGSSTVPYNYITVGFQDNTALRGLTYLYDNIYTPGSSQINNEFAILITQPYFMNDAPHLVINQAVLHDENGNGRIEAGETVNIGINLTNVGMRTAEQVRAAISFNPEYIEIINNTSTYPDIEFTETGSNFDYYTIRVSLNTPDNTTINGNLNIAVGDFYSPEYKEFNRSISFTVRKPSLNYRSYLINDHYENNDGILQPGENIKLIINVSNTTDLDIFELNASIATESPYLTINESEDYLPKMDPMSNYQFIFDVTAEEEIVGVSTIPVEFTLSSHNAGTIVETVNLGINQSGTLLQHFCNSLQPPGWTIQGISQAWSLSQTEVAGGTLPEIKVTGLNVSGTSRYISPAMDAREVSSVLLTFKHAATVLTEGFLTLKVATRSSFTGSWTDIWTLDFTEDYEATEERIPINNNLGTQSFQICFVLEGFFGAIEEWYVDDIVIQTSFGNTAILTGRLNILNHFNNDITDIRIKAGDYSTNIKEDGTYTLYLLPRQYPNFEIFDTRFQGNTFNNINVLAGTILEDYDFDMYYRTPPYNLRRFIDGEGGIELQWDHVYDRELDMLGFQRFIVYKQVNSLEFKEIILDEDTVIEFIRYDEEWNRNIYSFTDTDSLLSLDNIYRYTVKVEYATGLSDSTNHVYVNLTNELEDEDNPVEEIEETLEVHAFKLFPNYPNPFNPTTNIRFSIPHRSHVAINIYNIRGQLVKSLKNDYMEAGLHILQWNGDNNQGHTVGSGIYFIRIQNEENNAIRKALMLK